MSLESELSKLRHPSNSKNFPILGSVPPSHEFNHTFPMTKFLLDSEYADDDIANEIPAYYPAVAEILFSNKSFIVKRQELYLRAAYAKIPDTELDYFIEVASRLSDESIAESAKLPSSTVNKATETGIYAPCAGDTLGIWGKLVTKVFKRSQKRGPF